MRDKFPSIHVTMLGASISAPQNQHFSPFFFRTHGSVILDGITYSGDIRIAASGLLFLGKKGTLAIPFSDMKDVKDITKNIFQIWIDNGCIIEVKLFNAYLWSEKIIRILNIG